MCIKGVFRIMHNMNKKQQKFSSKTSKVGFKEPKEVGKFRKGNEENFLEILSDCIFICQMDNIIFANYKAVKLLGANKLDEIIGKSMRDFIIFNTNDKKYEKIFLKNPDEKLFTPTEVKIRKFNNSIVTANIEFVPYIYREEFHTMIVVKPKEREIIEEYLNNQMRLHKQLINFCPDSIFIFDESNIVFVNPAGVNLLGADSEEELIGRRFMDFVHPDVRDKIEKLTNEILINQDYPFTNENKLIKKNGDIIEVEVSNISFQEGESKIILSVVRDITERRKAEQKELELNKMIQWDKLKTEYFSNISHDLRTPLNIILSSLQLINALHVESVNCRKYSKVSKYIGTIKMNCYRLLKLISNLIDVTKLDSGFEDMNFVNANIVSVVEEITLSVADYTQSKNINLIFDTDIEEKITSIDVDKIERVMLNLLSNAIKFTEENGTIYVELHHDEKSIFISVRDTGVGIPENMIDVIFNRFSQVNSSHMRDYQGSGIGLSLVKSIIESHKGRISVKSKYGQGTEFIIELPIKILEEDCNKDENIIAGYKNLERINIEFSDVY